jgi:hypothetical protein
MEERLTDPLDKTQRRTAQHRKMPPPAAPEDDDDVSNDEPAEEQKETSSVHRHVNDKQSKTWTKERKNYEWKQDKRDEAEDEDKTTDKLDGSTREAHREEAKTTDTTSNTHLLAYQVAMTTVAKQQTMVAIDQTMKRKVMMKPMARKTPRALTMMLHWRKNHQLTQDSQEQLRIHSVIVRGTNTDMMHTSILVNQEIVAVVWQMSIHPPMRLRRDPNLQTLSVSRSSAV